MGCCRPGRPAAAWEVPAAPISRAPAGRGRTARRRTRCRFGGPGLRPWATIPATSRQKRGFFNQALSRRRPARRWLNALLGRRCVAVLAWYAQPLKERPERPRTAPPPENPCADAKRMSSPGPNHSEPPVTALTRTLAHDPDKVFDLAGDGAGATAPTHRPWRPCADGLSVVLVEGSDIAIGHTSSRSNQVWLHGGVCGCI